MHYATWPAARATPCKMSARHKSNDVLHSEHCVYMYMVGTVQKEKAAAADVDTRSTVARVGDVSAKEGGAPC